MRRKIVPEGRTLKIRDFIFDFSRRTYVMGILNVTPDSFSDGGEFIQKEKAVEHALEMEENGADIIDIGGESTRPGADSVTESEEEKRILPVIESIRKHSNVVISVDTYKSGIAEKAIDAGADIINDISGLNFDNKMVSVAAKYQCPVIVMHIKGTPKNMQKNPVYRDLIKEIEEYFENSIKKAEKAGLYREKIIIDPGIGFGKSVKDNYIILDKLNEFKKLNCPVLTGVSRKSFIGKLLDLPEKERIYGTAAAVCASILKGADIVRVHDVKEMIHVVKVADAVRDPERVSVS